MNNTLGPADDRQKMDIESRKDIEVVIQAFYEHAFQDPQIGFFFTDVAHMDLAAHIPVLTDFWESLLFRTQNYTGNVMQKHLDLHAKAPMEHHHFERWLDLFVQVIDQYYAGPRAEELKRRAQNIGIAIERRMHKPQREIPLSGKRN